MEVYKRLIVDGVMQDEPTLIYSEPEPPFIVQPDWLGLEQSLRYSALFATAYATASDKGFNLFTITLLNGKRGEASENALSFAFSALGVSWSESDKEFLNQMLSDNHFTIRV
jgi:hypothetical protein